MKISISTLKTLANARSLAPKIVKVAQKVYDEWDEDEDEYAGGGICHLIAEEIAAILDRAGVDCVTANDNFVQHVFVVAKLKEGVFSVDIPYDIYETGSMFSWVKRPGVKFDKDDVEFFKISSNPDDFDQHLD